MSPDSTGGSFGSTILFCSYTHRKFHASFKGGEGKTFQDSFWSLGCSVHQENLMICS